MNCFSVPRIVVTALLLSVAVPNLSLAKPEVLAPTELSGQNAPEVGTERVLGRFRLVLRGSDTEQASDRQWFRKMFGPNWRRALQFSLQAKSLLSSNPKSLPSITPKRGIVRWTDIPAGSFELIGSITYAGRVVVKDGAPLQRSIFISPVGRRPFIVNQSCDNSWVGKLWGDVNGDASLNVLDLDVLLSHQMNPGKDFFTDGIGSLGLPRPATGQGGLPSPNLDVPTGPLGIGDCLSNAADLDNALNALTGATNDAVSYADLNTFLSTPVAARSTEAYSAAFRILEAFVAHPEWNTILDPGFKLPATDVVDLSFNPESAAVYAERYDGQCFKTQPEGFYYDDERPGPVDDKDLKSPIEVTVLREFPKWGSSRWEFEKNCAEADSRYEQVDLKLYAPSSESLSSSW
jgi:hypothetical protein